MKAREYDDSQVLSLLLELLPGILSHLPEDIYSKPILKFIWPKVTEGQVPDIVENCPREWLKKLFQKVTVEPNLQNLVIEEETKCITKRANIICNHFMSPFFWAHPNLENKNLLYRKDQNNERKDFVEQKIKKEFEG